MVREGDDGSTNAQDHRRMDLAVGVAPGVGRGGVGVGKGGGGGVSCCGVCCLKEEERGGEFSLL